MSSSEDDLAATPGSLADDLFGSDDEAPAEKVRELSDKELDSGDDEDRDDRAARYEDRDVATPDVEDVRTIEVELPRHPVPRPIDGEVRISHGESTSSSNT